MYPLLQLPKASNDVNISRRMDRLQHLQSYYYVPRPKYTVVLAMLIKVRLYPLLP